MLYTIISLAGYPIQILHFIGKSFPYISCLSLHGLHEESTCSCGISWQTVLIYGNQTNGNVLCVGSPYFSWFSLRQWIVLGSWKRGVWDSGFKFQTDMGFRIQISNRAGFGIQISIEEVTFIVSQFQTIQYPNILYLSDNIPYPHYFQLPHPLFLSDIPIWCRALRMDGHSLL